MKKTIFTILLVACISAMLVACEPKDTEGSSSPNAPQSSSQKVQKPSYHNNNAAPAKEELANAKG